MRVMWTALFAIGMPAAVAAAQPDDSGYTALLQQYVDEVGLVDYAGMQANRAPLDAYAQALADTTPASYEGWAEADQIAFWINAYNAYTLIAILDNYPIEAGGWISSFRFPENSIRQISGVWTEMEWPVLGGSYTLDAMEHQILRKEFDEPRMHMAIVCASIGCPYLRNEAFSGDTLDAQLEAQTRQFLGDASKGLDIDRERGQVRISPIFNWFGKDWIPSYAPDSGFDSARESQRAVLHFIAQHVSEEAAAFLRDGAYRVRYLPYDWALNEQPATASDA